eukprot:c531_g1_i1 orf=984-2627(+)
MDVMKLSRNRSSLHQGNSQEKASDSYFRSSAGLFRVILHALLCVAALVLGFRLSGEARLVIISVKPSHATFFSNSITRFYKARGFDDLSTGDSFVKDDGRDFMPTLPSGLPPSSAGFASSRVHVGRHEILIRSWPHPDPVQTIAAHRLIELVQNEQQRVYGLQERKQFLVITPTYVHAFQAAYVSCLIHTLRIITGPLTWIVVEAGGISNETAELLFSSQLHYHHVGIQESMPADWEHRKQLETLMRLEGLRFIREHRLDGIVLFLDDSSTYSLELFDVAQKVEWIGSFSVGHLFSSGMSEFSEDSHKLSHDSSSVSKGSRVELELDHSSGAEESLIHAKFKNLSAAKEDFGSGSSLPLQGPVCNSSGHIVGWYLPFQDGQEHGTTSRSLEWVGFALNAKIVWEDYKPIWINSWNELFGVNKSLPDSPLAFLKDYSFVEPLGNCGRDVLMWWLRLEADVGSQFPSRWILNPPLEMVVPSKRTPWSDKLLAESHDLVYPPPPPSVLLPYETSNQHAKGRVKGAKGGRGKRRGHHTKRDQGKTNAEQAP